MNNEDTQAAKGGDFNFSVGKGYAGGPDGSFVWFDASGGEALRLDPDGTFSICGVPVEKDRLIFAAFKNWLASATLNIQGNASFTPHSIQSGDATPPSAEPTEPASSTETQS